MSISINLHKHTYVYKDVHNTHIHIYVQLYTCIHLYTCIYYITNRYIIGGKERVVCPLPPLMFSKQFYTWYFPKEKSGIRPSLILESTKLIIISFLMWYFIMKYQPHTFPYDSLLIASRFAESIRNCSQGYLWHISPWLSLHPSP